MRKIRYKIAVGACRVGWLDIVGDLFQLVAKRLVKLFGDKRIKMNRADLTVNRSGTGSPT